MMVDLPVYYSVAEAGRRLYIPIKRARQANGILFRIDPSLSPLVKMATCRTCGVEKPSRYLPSGWCAECGPGKGGTAMLRARMVVCETCATEWPIGKCPKGYCPDCRAKGLGHKAGKEKLAATFSGEGNPNFVHGLAPKAFRSRREYKSWRAAIFGKFGGRCALTGRDADLDAPHILPFALFPQRGADASNGVLISRLVHYYVHLQRLDILLLPSLAGKADLAGAFIAAGAVEALATAPSVVLDCASVLSVTPKNYQRELHRLLPDFRLSASGQRLACLGKPSRFRPVP